MSNSLQVEQVQNIRRLLSGMSIRSIERITGVHRDTVMRIKHGTTAKSKREDGICRATAQAKRIGLYGQPIPEDKRLGWTCAVPYCDNPDHFIICENLNHGRRNYKPVRERLWNLTEDEFFDLPDEPKDEKNVLKFRTGLIAHNAPHFIVRSLPTGGIRIIRKGSWHDERKGFYAAYPQLIPHAKGFMRLELSWEPEHVGDCLRAPTPHTAYKMRFRVMGIDRTMRDKTILPDVTCGDSLCYATEHIFMRRRKYGRTAKYVNDMAGGRAFLGLLSGTCIPVERLNSCSIRGCVQPATQQSSLCRHHETFFEVEGLGGVVDVNDMFADDNGGDSTFTVGMLWEDRYNWLNVKREGSTWKSSAERENDRWWHDNVIAKGLEVEGVVTPKIRGSVLADVLARKPEDKRLKLGVGAQTSLHGKMRNHSKKKIRKVQRNRPAGWHGGHGDHDPQYFDRQSIKAMDYDDFAPIDLSALIPNEDDCV